MNAIDSEHRQKSTRSWGDWVLFSVLVFIGGTILGLLSPLWMAPPYGRYTLFLYAPLPWLSLIVLFVAMRRCAVVSAWEKAVSLVFSLLLSIVASAVIGLFIVVAPIDCNTTSNGDVFVSYSCSTSFYTRVYIQTFVGIRFFPLVLHTGTYNVTGSSFG